MCICWPNTSRRAGARRRSARAPLHLERREPESDRDTQRERTRSARRSAKSACRNKPHRPHVACPRTRRGWPKRNRPIARLPNCSRQIATLADAAAELSDKTFRKFENGAALTAYMRSRGIIAADAAAPIDGSTIDIPEHFLIARRVQLGMLMDLSSQPSSTRWKRATISSIMMQRSGTLSHKGPLRQA